MDEPRSTGLIDTHCHLSDPAFDGDREAALARAWAAGLSAVVEVADTEENWAKARSLAEHPSGRVWWAVGFHPYVADRFDPGTIHRLKEALRHPRAVAVGEIGLDYFKHCAVPRDRQRDVFESLVRCGIEAGKPLILHCRECYPDSVDAWGEMWSILDRAVPRSPGVKGVAHCFQGTLDIARRLIERGFLVGVDAPVTYPKAESLRAVLRELPLESLVLETDGPYLPPQTRRGGRNEPSFLPETLEAVARLRGVSEETAARATSANAGRLFHFSSVDQGTVDKA